MFNILLVLVDLLRYLEGLIHVQYHTAYDSNSDKQMLTEFVINVKHFAGTSRSLAISPRFNPRTVSYCL